MTTFLLSYCQSKVDTLFQAVPSSQSGLDFANRLEKSEAFNILEYLYYYNGGGIASGDINNDGLPDLYFTSNQGADRLYLNRGDFKFKDITESAGVGGEAGLHKWTTGVTMVDINADGLLDIYVCEVAGYKGLKGKNRLYINNGDLTFTEEAAAYGLDISSYSQQAAFFDYDLDGDLDLFLLNHAVHTPNAYKKAVVRNERDLLAGDRLFRNDAVVHNLKAEALPVSFSEEIPFVEVTEEAGIYSGAMGYGLAVSIGDVNNDGYPDIYVSNDFHENDYLYLNQGDGTFREDIAGAAGHVPAFSMGNDIADVNNDGRLDILTTDMKPEAETVLKSSSGVDPYDVYQYKLNFGYHYQYSRNMLQLNRGLLPGAEQVKFSELGQQAGIAATDWSWSALMADLDNDGYKDIFITNGIPTRPNDLDYIRYTSNELATDSLNALEMIEEMPEGKGSNYAFRNLAAQQSRGEAFFPDFKKVTREWGLELNGFSNGANYVDLDRDGDLDLVLNNLDAVAVIYKNRSREQGFFHFLEIALKGNASNPNGIGTRVELFSGDHYQLLENHLTRGWLSSSNLGRLHFGLGTAEQVDSLKVSWPDGRTQMLRNLSVNKTITVTHENAAFAERPAPKSHFPPLTDVSDASGIDFRHKEVFHNDFSKEKLIPHLLSTEGPKVAVADVNGDGLEDFYIGGGKGQSGALYLQQENGPEFFRKADRAPFQDFWALEETGLAFFDVDQDGDEDLYVVSGGGEFLQGAPLRDRLYLNDGQGNFEFSEAKLPNTEFNGSCVVPFDANEDGLPDLFIGHRSIPLQYGLPGASKFLLNQGNGEFLDATVRLLENGGRIGMVTDAVWIEERKELVIVGEWMPVTIYSFRGGNIERRKLEQTAGWWNTVEVADIDGDGDRDLLLGNTGLNTNLSASVDEPLDLYVQDYDKNLSTDPVMAYYKNGKQWVYPGFDLLVRQIVGVHNTFRTYRSYAHSTFPEIFPAEVLAKSYHAQVQALQSAIMEYQGGEYKTHALPAAGQIAPVYGVATDDFDGDTKMEIIAAGNFYGNPPVMGRSDASYGSCFEVEKEGGIVFRQLNELGFAFYGEVRDLKIIKGAKGKKFLLAARNNDRVQLFAYGTLPADL